MPSTEPTAGLFDGDILGDELIDIYNAAVVGGGDDDAMNGKLEFERFRIHCLSQPFSLCANNISHRNS
jgi:hypothetical protein